jgi:putative PIN family toxin of toxin-antitoxin system
MRIVLDANVLVSALISVKGTPARLLAYWQEGKFDVVVSPAMLQELERVLHYPRLQQQHHLPEEEIQRFLRFLRAQAIEVDPSEEIAIVERDPTDNRYLECALAGDAQYIVSGDGHLLGLKEYRGIRILTPMEFVTLLKLEGEPTET